MKGKRKRNEMKERRLQKKIIDSKEEHEKCVMRITTIIVVIITIMMKTFCATIHNNNNDLHSLEGANIFTHAHTIPQFKPIFCGGVGSKGREKIIRFCLIVVVMSRLFSYIPQFCSSYHFVRFVCLCISI